MSDILASLKQPGKSKWFIIGGGTIAAYFVYKYVKDKNATATTTTDTSTSTATDTSIDPTTGIPYSEEEDYAGIPSSITNPVGLTFNAQTGQFEQSPSTIIGASAYSTNTGQSAAPSDPDALASNFLSAYSYNSGQPGGGYYGVTTSGETVNLTPAEQLALAGQNYQFGSYTGSARSPIPTTPAAVTTSPAVPI